MIWTQEYQLFVQCDHSGESSFQKEVVIFRVLSGDGIYTSGPVFWH